MSQQERFAALQAFKAAKEKLFTASGTVAPVRAK